VQIATGFFAEIKERIAPRTEGASNAPKPYIGASEYLLFATRDEAHTLALRRVRAIVAGSRKP